MDLPAYGISQKIKMLRLCASDNALYLVQFIGSACHDIQSGEWKMKTAIDVYLVALKAKSKRLSPND